MKHSGLYVVGGGVVAIEDSIASNSSLHFANLTATINNSVIQSSTIDLIRTALSLENSEVDCCGNHSAIISEWMTEKKNDTADAPISLDASNMTISNSLMVDNTSLWFVRCVNNRSSLVSGDLLGWRISPQCQTRYNPLTITQSMDFQLMMIGAEQLIQLELSEEISGVNVTLSLTSTSTFTMTSTESPPFEPLRVTMYLTRSGCTPDIQFSAGSSLVSTTASLLNDNSTMMVSFWFDGPSPGYLEPSGKTTVYCLMINSSAPVANDAIVNLNVQLISRRLTSSTISIAPKYAIYSSLFEVNYQFFDQWGAPFVNSDEVALYCGDEAVACGNTNAESSSGHIFVSFNQSVKTNWKLFTVVNASLSAPNSQPSKAYGNVIIVSSMEITRLTNKLSCDFSVLIEHTAGVGWSGHHWMDRMGDNPAIEKVEIRVQEPEAVASKERKRDSGASKLVESGPRIYRMDTAAIKVRVEYKVKSLMTDLC